MRNSIPHHGSFCGVHRRDMVNSLLSEFRRTKDGQSLELAELKLDHLTITPDGVIDMNQEGCLLKGEGHNPLNYCTGLPHRRPIKLDEVEFKWELRVKDLLVPKQQIEIEEICRRPLLPLWCAFADLFFFH